MTSHPDQSPTFSRRAEHITLSATKQMPILAAAVGGCVSLGQGVPSFSTPDHVVDALVDALFDNPAVGKYSLQPGLPELRRAIARQLKDEKGLNYSPHEEILVTVGAMGALAEAFLAIVNPGDEVLLPEPTYASYIEQVQLSEGIPMFVPLRQSDWGLDLEAIAAAITPRTKMIVLCNPSNPTGVVYDKASLTDLAQLVKEKQIFMIIDETYDYLTYGDAKPFCPASLPGMKPWSIVINSFSKKYALTGWRVGYVAASSIVAAQLAKIHDATAICAPTPGQFAALTALTGPQACIAQMNDTLDQRRQLVIKRMDKLSQWFDYIAPSGAFYLMARWLGKPMTSQTLAERLIKEAKVVTIPGSAFGPGGEGHLRISFGGSEEELNEAFDRLETWVAKAD